MFGPPVDLSFQELESVSGVLLKEPRASLRTLHKNSEGKYLSRALRLNNNRLCCLSGLQYLINNLLAEPVQLGWLDVSFNHLTQIEPVLCELHELRVLYLHGNNIYILSEVDKLGHLPYLHTITLHGNAIETTKNYRKHVISTLPHLKKLDYSLVTDEERTLSNI
ncbi:leucine-rich repeat-containing protein 51-like [Thalassophryne amazonica]|uniref:leucine-rich repeat-containing protein 51-like n=1 Tax=Thalassophryne amazonica TaxID=390379 RepID=UPI0014709D5F|nr:leucine-rich repeat-containing protein 51-like [Thalassophryne amazonica]